MGVDFPTHFQASTVYLRAVLCCERLKFTAFFYLILGRCLNPGSIFCSKYLLKASLFTVSQHQRPPVKSMAPLQTTERDVIIHQFTCALILACSRTLFSSQPLLLQQHPVLSRNLDFQQKWHHFYNFMPWCYSYCVPFATKSLCTP